MIEQTTREEGEQIVAASIVNIDRLCSSREDYKQMRLSENDAKLFYATWLPLLDYVNEKRKVNPNLRNMASASSLNPRDVKEVANVLWSEPTLIDDYLRDNEGLTEQELLSSWKRRVNGKFLLERILKKGAILISLDDETVYQVSGIISTWEEMFGSIRLPMMMETTLIPFHDVIISDGLIERFPISFGGNMTRSFKDIYINAKNNNKVKKQL